MIVFILQLILLFAFTNAVDVGDSPPSSTNPPPLYVRGITGIDDILAEGVFIDHRYNDTDDSDSIGGLRSAPGCPKNDAGLPWVYYPPGPVTPNTRCYLVGEVGPCQQGEKLFVERGSLFGYCNCECFENMEELDTSREMLCTAYWLDGVKNVFHPATKKCYQLYSQGHCSKNEWLAEVKEKIVQNLESTSAPLTKHEQNNSTNNVDNPVIPVWKSGENDEKLVEVTGSVPQNGTSSIQPLTKCKERECAEGLYPVWETDAKGEVIMECIWPTPAGGGSYSNLIPSTCSNEDEKYSLLLQKCVRKFSYTSVG